MIIISVVKRCAYSQMSILAIFNCVTYFSEVISDLESSKYQMAEYRISIYGRSKSEWDKLAKWVVNNKLFSPNVRWLIQIPRLYDIYKGSSLVINFEDVIRSTYIFVRLKTRSVKVILTYVMVDRHFRASL